jgi:hypothetical protein
MDVSLESIPRKGLLYHPSRGHISRTVLSELVEGVGGQERKEGNLEFGSNQDSVGKGCQKSGCGGYGDCRVVVIYSVVSCQTEGVRRDSVVLYLSVRLQ